MSDLYILEGRTPVPVNDVREWGKWFENADRRVALTHIFGTDFRVSTVFIGLNHRFDEGPPLLFETMVFDSDHDELSEYTDRYSTWSEAETGHKHVVGVLTRHAATTTAARS